MRHKLSYLLIFLLTASALPAWGQTFEKEIDIGDSFDAFSIVGMEDGGFLGCGTYGLDGSACIFKLDNSSNLQWVKGFGNGKNGFGNSVIKTNNKNFFITGAVYFDSGAKSFVIKFDSKGNILWRKLIQCTGSLLAYAIADDNEGGCVVAGNLNNDAFSMKLDSVGSLQWIRTFENNITVGSLIRLNNGNYIVLGFGPFTNNDELWITELDSSGQILSRKVIQIPNELQGRGATKTMDSGFAICGESFGETSDIYVAKFDSKLNLLWANQIDIFSNEEGRNITEGLNGDIYVTGRYSESDLMSFESDSSLIVRLNKMGEILSIKIFSPQGYNSIGNSITIAQDSSPVIGGMIKNSSQKNGGMFLGKLDSDLNGCYWKNTLYTNQHVGVEFNDSSFNTVNLIAELQDLKVDTTLSFIEIGLCNTSSAPESISEANNISLFPNPLPSQTPLTISIDNSLPSGVYILALRDLLGNIIKQKKIQLIGAMQDVIFDVPECAAGVYFVEIVSEKDPSIIRRMKLVKE